MTHLRELLAFVCVAVASAACVSTPPEAPETRPIGVGRVEVTMTGFKGEHGQALVAIFLDAEHWPDADGPVFSKTVVPIQDGQAVAAFDAVPAGPFAVSVFHDENGDRQLNTNVLGIPSEGYGFSADARSTFGPPSFEEARLELAAGETKQITVNVE